MKNLSKSLKVVLLSIVTIGMLASCNDDTSETAPIEPQEPKFITVGFDGYTLTPESQAQGKKVSALNEDEWGVSHSYETTGYTVQVSGGVADGSQVFNDVDLASAQLSIEVVGDVTVTLYHPTYIEDDVTEIAYYGKVEEIPYTSDSYVITAELLQTFVIVVEDNGAEGVIEDIGVNTVIGKDHDIPYYSGAANIVVDVYTYGQDLTGTAAANPGTGVRFTVTSSGELIEFVLPEFGEPIDGGLNPLPPVK